MDKKQLIFLKCFLTPQMNFILMYAGVMTLFGFLGKPIFYAPCCSLAVAAVFLCLIRIYQKNPKVIWLCHLAVLAVCILIPHPDLISRFIFLAEAGIILFYSAYARFSRGREMEKPISFIWAVVMIAGLCLLQYVYGNREILVCYPYFMLFYVIYYFFYRYIETGLEFLIVHERNDGYVPQREILKRGGANICIFNLVTALLLIGALKSNWNFMNGQGKAWLGTLFSNLLNSFAEAGSSFHDTGAETEEVIEKARELVQTQSRENILTVFWGILDFLIDFLKPVVCIGIFVLLIVGCIRIGKSLVQKRSKVQMQVCTVGVTDTKERIIAEKRKQKKGFHYIGAAGRIRYLYRKAALSHGGAVSQQTARECMEELIKKRMETAGDNVLKEEPLLYESAMQFAGLYEKARYSKESCTGEDAKKAGQLYRKLRRQRL